MTISLIYYNQETLEEKLDATVEESSQYLKEEGVTWIHITGAHNRSIIEKLGALFKLHPLILEDIATFGERSKMESYDENFFFILRLLNLEGDQKQLIDRQVSLVLGKNYVISFFETETRILSPIIEKIRAGNTRIRKLGADYLTYAIIDAIVDNYFVILEQVDDKLEDLEEELLHDPKQKTLQKIQRSKKEMTILRQSVWPMREVISHFRRVDTPLIHSNTQLYLHDVYDHTIQAIDTIEGFRDVVGGLLEIYLSTISQRLNEIMKVLTVVATIFAPLTFITGVYGMNFEYIPILKTDYGIFVIFALMMMAAGLMLLFFRKKRWI